MAPSNVLLVVLDACRLDAARTVAPNLQKLADENLWFENAVAPAGSSLPSHVSMFTGTYPHKHGTYKQTHEIDSMPLLSELGKAGYFRYGVSANGFASAKYGFDSGFDEFYNTQGVTVYPDGLDVHGYARTVREEEDEDLSTHNLEFRRLLRTIVEHDHPVKSTINVAAAGLSQLIMRYPVLSRIPHRRFNRYNEFSYDPEQNTEWLSRLFEAAADDDRPFFAFANYMDPHHPYTPPERYQQEYCGGTFRYHELDRLAQETHPFEFLRRCESGNWPSEERLETIRGLYAGEVRTVDEHLGRLVQALERYGLRDDTVIVITADHGENLGEANEMGETRMGHVCSASDAHLRVPLVIAHPDIEGRKIETPVSLKDLSGLFISGLDRLIETNGCCIGSLEQHDGIVASEVPATANDALAGRHPDLQEILQRHLSAIYTEEWRVVLSSNGTQWAWKSGEERPIEEVPDRIVEKCYEHLNALEEVEDSDRELTEMDVSHLEALGYI